MTAEAKLKELNITLPQPPAAVAAYVPWVRTGNLIITSGQLPWEKGKMLFAGKLGAELNEEQGYRAARLCAINAIAQLKAAVGDLQRIRRIVRLEGNVHSAPGFQGQPKVLNGASELFNAVFGERGQHTRTALGINEMPLDAAVQLSVWAEVEEQSPPRQPGEKIRTNIAHFTLAVRDVQKTQDFFARTIGWRPINRPNNIGIPAAWMEIAPGQEIHLLQIPVFEPSAFEKEFGRHIAINYPHAGFAELKKRLLDQGAEIIPPQRETPFERFFFTDPNGYVFEIVAVEREPEV